MHELTIARQIISIVEEEIGNHLQKGYVRSITFKTGKLNAIIPESLIFIFEAIKTDYSSLKDAHLIIEEIPLRIRCKNCGNDSAIEEPQFTCNRCKSPEIEIVSGSEMIVEKIDFIES